jgi:hypothetical protein
MLDSVHLEIVLILMQERCTVCVERTILCTGWNYKVTWVLWNLTSVNLEIVQVSVQDGSIVCTKHTIGSEVILDEPGGTPK